MKEYTFDEIDLFEDEEEILTCDVCGRAESEELKINIHSMVGIPCSGSYCEECDSKGYVTQFELLYWMAKYPRFYKKDYVDDKWWTETINNIRTFLNKDSHTFKFSMLEVRK
jgi:hypothetical protein